MYEDLYADSSSNTLSFYPFLYFSCDVVLPLEARGEGYGLGS